MSGAIVSASRRTDIPAHYSQWFFNRIDAGWCLVPNPMNRSQIRRVDLTPEAVGAFVFWSKNPQPLADKLHFLDERGFDYAFLFTLNDYPGWLEPNVPPLERRVAAFKRIAGEIGAERVIWRYDPIVFTDKTDVDYHKRAFERLIEQLSGGVRRVIISFMDPYRHVIKRLNRQKPAGESIIPPEDTLDSVYNLSRFMGRLCKASGVEIQSCAEKFDLQSCGINPGSCIDGALLSRLFDKSFPISKDRSQRSKCLCSPSVDIGMYDSCPNLCSYCYAIRSDKVYQRNLSSIRSDSVVLCGGKDI